MSEQKISRTPAFPTSVSVGDKPVTIQGMTLRDYFAAKAMQSLIHIGSIPIKEHTDKKGGEYDYPDQPFYFGGGNTGDGFMGEANLSADAYAIADAMLAERERTQEQSG